MRRADQYVFDERNRRTPAPQPAAPAPQAPTPGPSTQPQTPQTSAGPSQRCRTTSTTTTTSQTPAPPRTNPTRNTSQTYRTTTTPQAPQLSPQASTSSQRAYRQTAPSIASSSTAPTPSGSERRSRRTQGEEPEFTGLELTSRSRSRQRTDADSASSVAQRVRGVDLNPIDPTTAVPPGLDVNMRVFASGLVSFRSGGLRALVDCLCSPLVIPVASSHAHAIGIAAKSRAGIVMKAMASARWYSSLP